MAADPRRTGWLDDFNRANENPLSNGGRWSQARSNFSPMELINNNATHQSGSQSSYSYWNPHTFAGDIEVWGLAEGGNANGIAWGLMLTNDMGGLSIDGYLYRQEVSSSGHYQKLYRFDNGSATTLATAGPGPSVGFSSGLGGNAYLCLKRKRSTGTVECWWVSSGTWPSWTLQFNVSDATYSDGLYLGIGITDNSGSQLLGWDGIGGGGGSLTGLPQIIRRTHRRGGRI